MSMFSGVYEVRVRQFSTAGGLVGRRKSSLCVRAGEGCLLWAGLGAEGGISLTHAPVPHVRVYRS